MRLHHRMGLIRRRVSGVELNRCCGEGSGKISNGCLGLAAFADRRRFGPVSTIGPVERSLGFFVVYADEFRSRSSLLEGFGDDHSNGLVIVINLGTAEQ